MQVSGLILSMYPLGDFPDFLVITQGAGSGFPVTVLKLKEDIVPIVLEDGSFMFPEFISGIKHDETEIILPERCETPTDNIIYPDNALIYKFNGQKFVMVKKVKWKDRFTY
jgi:hypothetical protein